MPTRFLDVGPRQALLVCFLLALLHTWPLGSAPGALWLRDHADAELNAWQLSWLARAFASHPAHLFDGNIFAPEPRTVTYTDPLLVPALVGAPIWWATRSPVLTFNVTLIAGLTLTAWAGWFAARHWSGSGSAALVGASLVAFNVHMLTRLAHTAAAHLWGVPLALWVCDLILENPRRRRVLALVAVVAATAVTSAYTLALVGVIVGIEGVAAIIQRRWRSVSGLLIGLIGGLVVAAPVLWPYAQLAASGVYRSLASVAQFSATPAGYLTSTSHVHAGWSSPFFRDEVNVFFAGVTGLALAGAGVVALRRRGAGMGAASRSSRRRNLGVLLLVGAAGAWLSLGPATSAYRILYEWFPPLRGLRAAARFGYLFLVAVGLAAAGGMAAIGRGLRKPSWRPAVLMIVLALVTIEVWSGPVATRPFNRVPPIYQHVAAAAEPVLLVEVPFYPPEQIWANGEYVLYSTAHWRPLMNGYSGHIPPSYRRRAAAFWFFPEDWAIEAIRAEGATHLMVHLEKFTPAESAAIEARLRRQTEFVLMATDPIGHRLYRVRDPAGAANQFGAPSPSETSASSASGRVGARPLAAR